MAKRKPRHLEIGIGKGHRLRQIVAQGRHGEVVGIDSKKSSLKIPGAKLLLGKKGDVKVYLKARRGKFDEINAEYFFDSLVPDLDVGFFLYGGRSFKSVLDGKTVIGGGFQPLIDEIKRRDKLRKAEIDEIIPLVKTALPRNGTLRLETTKRFVRRNKAWLKRHGFQSRARKMKPEEVVSLWGKKYLGRARKGEEDVHPYEIIARVP